VSPSGTFRPSAFLTSRFDRLPPLRPVRPAVRRWAVLGALLGAAVGAAAFAPAAWLAGAVASATGERLLLADPRGTVWSGDAVAVLSAGPGSRDARALPGRLHWSLGWADGAVELRLAQACCLRNAPRLRLSPRLGRPALELRGEAGNATPGRPGGPVLALWPAAWLGGLGTPWNTLELEGELRLSSPGLSLVPAADGQWQIQGQAVLELADVASRLSTLPALGSYRLSLQGNGADLGLRLDTSGGALQLQARGQWSAHGLQLRGDARAAPGSEAALANLLNIIGRRQGERSLIAIG